MEYTDYTAVFRRRASAYAIINGSPDYPHIRGRALFYQVRGGVVMRVDVTGLPENEEKCKAPVFGFHIHSGTECSGNKEDAFADTDGHYNPNDCLHPYHAGDLPPLFGAKGKAFGAFLTNRFTVKEVVGRTVIIHSHPDDFMTQPSGNSGEKIACGIIKRI